MKWEDNTHYRRGDKERIPEIWIAQIGQLRISVVYNHIFYPGQWVCSCNPFFEEEELGAIDAELAKQKAVECVRVMLQDTLKRLDNGDT